MNALGAHWRGAIALVVISLVVGFAIGHAGSRAPCAASPVAAR